MGEAHDDGSSTTQGPGAVAHPLFARRYQLAREAAIPSGRAVLRATDAETGMPVVIHTYPASALDTSRRARLREARAALAVTPHPAVAHMTDGGQEGPLVYAVRPYVEGEGLDARIRDGPFDLATVLAVGAKVARALEVVHQAGFVHGALHPSNVIVRGHGETTEAILVDTLLRTLAADQEARTDIGYVRRLAPEQAGVLQAPIGPATDLYGLGGLLYEMCTGDALHAGDDLGAVLRSQLSAPLPEIRRAGHDIPRALEEIIRRLVRKSPAERYATASAVAGDLEALATAVASGVADPALVVGLGDRRSSLTPPGFVGRVQELRMFDAMLDATAQGKGGLAFIEAVSGGGKTWLVDEASRRCHARGVDVYFGQGVEDVAAKPFQVLRDVAAAAGDRGATDRVFRDGVRTVLGEWADAATAALPQLAPLLGTDAVRGLGPEEHGEARTMEGLAALLDALGVGGRPVLVILDDFQWADELSIRLLTHWARQAREQGTGRHVTVVLVFRSEEVDSDHAVRRLPTDWHLRLPPFGPGELAHLIGTMAGSVPHEVHAVVRRLSDGNPFMASAVLRGLIEADALQAGPAGWTVDGEALESAGSSEHAAAFLHRRLDLLPPDAQDLLTVAAVVGKEFGLRFTAHLAGLPTDRADAAIDEARTRHIVLPAAKAGAFSFAHDRIREAVLARMDAELKRSLHRRAAAALEHGHTDRVFDLAYHFDAAGDARRAVPYALAAAAEARGRSALDVAERYYQIAHRGLAHGESRARFDVTLGLGEVLMLRGAYDDAKKWLRSARELAHDPITRARVDGVLGELAFKRGDTAEAMETYETAITTMGERIPGSTLGLVLALIWETLVQTMHSLFPKHFLGRDGPMDEERRQLLQLFNRLPYAYWFNRGVLPTAWAHLRAMNMAELHPPSPELAQAYSEHAPACTMAPWWSRGIDYAQRSHAMREEMGDLWGQGQSLHFIGVGLYGASRFEQVLLQCREAARILERTGDKWEAHTARWHLAFAHYRLGHLDQAVAEARRVHASGQEIGDRQACAITLGAWAKATGGDVPQDAVERELERGRSDVHTASEVLTADALRRLRLGDLDGAVRTMAEADALVRAKHLRQEYVAPVPAWYATMLRKQAAATSPLAAGLRRRRIKAARKVAKRAVRLARAYRNNLAHAEREAGVCAAMDGDQKAAHRHFSRSLEVAEELGMRHEAAMTRRAHARMRVARGEAEAQADLDDAEAQIAILRGGGSDGASGDVVNVSLVERFSTTLGVGRRIVSALDEQAVLDAVLQAGDELLRGERCAVVRVEEGVPQADPWQVPLIEQAMRRDGCALFRDDRPAGWDDVLIMSGIRCALAVPIRVRGEVHGALVVAHTQVADAFAERDRSLAEYVATLAGAALENAEGFTALREAHEEVRYQKTLLEAQSEASIDGILLVDRQGQMVSFNRRFVDLWRLPEDVVESRDDERAIGSVLGQLVDPDEFTRKIRHLYDHEQEVSRDEIRLKDGRTIDRYSAPVRSPDGRVQGRIWVFRDITDRMAVEADLRAAYEELRELDQLKTRFINTAAHELRTPLTPLRLQIAVMAKQFEKAGIQGMDRGLAVFERNVDRLARLVEDILDASRLQAGRLGVRPRTVLIDDLVHDAIESFDGAYADKGVALVQEGEQGLRVVADPHRVTQVLFNYLSNALKFTPQGGTVRVVTRVEDGHATVRVVDTGDGLARDQLDRLFKPFSQAHDSNTNPGTGAGLGLYISKGLIEAHGGKAWAQSDGPGHGSTFAFAIPALRDDQ